MKNRKTEKKVSITLDESYIILHALINYKKLWRQEAKQMFNEMKNDGETFEQYLERIGFNDIQSAIDKVGNAPFK